MGKGWDNIAITRDRFTILIKWKCEKRWRRLEISGCRTTRSSGKSRKRKEKEREGRENHANGTIDFHLFPFAFRRRRGVEDRASRKAEGWEQVKGVRDSLNPLNARNNLRSVPSATILSRVAGRGGEEGFLSLGLPLLLLLSSLFFHPPRKPTPLSAISSMRHPPPELTGSVHKPEERRRRRRLIDRLTFDLLAHPFTPPYTPAFWQSRKCYLARSTISRMPLASP